MSTLDVEQCAVIYARMKQAKDNLTKQLEDIEADMDKLKLLVLEHMQANDLKSLKTAVGASLSIRATTRYSTADFVHFCSWARERPDAMSLFEKRLHQGNILQWLQDHPDDTPPGLQANHTTTLVIKPAKE